MTRRDIIIELVRSLPEAIDPGGGNIGHWIHGGPESKLLTYGPLWHAACPKRCDGTRRNPSDPRKCVSPYPELVRCLDQLRHEHPLQHDHLSWRYWGGHTSRQEVRFVREGYKLTVARGQLHPHQEILNGNGPVIKQSRKNPVLDCVVYAWPPWVHEPEVHKAIAHLSDVYQGEPFLPAAAAA